MKIMTVFGTRPEIIRLSLIIRTLDEHADQVLVHTGQNSDPNLSDVFLKELGIRPVDFHLGTEPNSFAGRLGRTLAGVEELLLKAKPDRFLILGDTNSGLSAIIAARHGVPVYHLEAGNRCYDNRVPEEVNRRIIDHSSDVLLPYTRRSAENLVAEGIQRERIFVVGNPISEVLASFEKSIDGSDVLHRLGLPAGGYFLATLHRAENVDVRERLGQLLRSLTDLAAAFGKQVILSVHPRTASRMDEFGFSVDRTRVRLEKPFGLFDFVKLEKNALGIVTDSGTVQEEACILGVPNVTLRDVTERPETTECGSNLLAGVQSDLLVAGMKMAVQSAGSWEAPEEYRRSNVALVVAKILLSYRNF